MINGSSVARLLFRHLHFTHTTLFTIVISILIACITAPTAIAITSEEMLSDPVLEQRARDCLNSYAALFAKTSQLTTAMQILHATFALRCGVRLQKVKLMVSYLKSFARNMVIMYY
jgi:hypothetical protein